MAAFHRKKRALSRVMRNILRADANNADAVSAPAPPARAPAYSLPADIPKSYDDTYARAIPKDPQNTVLYWERPKEVTRECVFPDKGTAHVGNHEVERVQQQLGHGHDWNNSYHHHHGGENRRQGDGGNNSQWLSDNSRWLNNTKPWDGGSAQHHQGGTLRQDDGGSFHNNSGLFGNFTDIISNLIGQCRQFIEDHKHHEYAAAPSSGEIYKVNEKAQG